MNAAAFSAIITDMTAISPPGIFGITEASATRIPDTKSINQIRSKELRKDCYSTDQGSVETVPFRPWTLRSDPTTDMGSDLGPILQVPHRELLEWAV